MGRLSQHQPIIQGGHIPWSVDDSPLSALGLYLDEIGDLPQLTHDEERTLALRVRAGDGLAKERMILANLKLVVYMAKRYGERSMDLSDHIQNGFFGLVKAVERFDPDRNVHFSTYACHWIRQSITREQANTSRLVRLPLYIQTQINALDRATDSWFLAHGSEPEADVLAATLGIPVSQVHLLQSVRGQALSLDYSYDNNDEEGHTLLERIADPREEAAFERLDKQDEDDQIRETVHSALRRLTERERTVVTLLFGLDGSQKRTLAEVGRVIGVTRERVRQIQVVALEKLRREPALGSLFCTSSETSSDRSGNTRSVA